MYGTCACIVIKHKREGIITYHKQRYFKLLMTSSAERVTIKKSQKGSRVQTEVFEISTEVSTHFKRRRRIGQRCGDVIKR